MWPELQDWLLRQPGLERRFGGRPVVTLRVGREAEGNPVILFAAPAGAVEPACVIKISRFPGQPHLRQERALLGTVRERVGAELAAALVEPWAGGEVRGHSVSVFPFVPGQRQAGLWWRLRGRLRLARRAAEWLSAAAVRTARPLAHDMFERLHLHPLREYAAGSDVGAVHGCVRRALCLLEDWAAPVRVLEHGDFWHGNLRLTDRGGLRILDWGGCTDDGLPGADLLNLLAVLAPDRRRAAGLIRAYATVTGVSSEVLGACFVSYLLRRRLELARVRPQAGGGHAGDALLRQVWILPLCGWA